MESTLKKNVQKSVKWTGLVTLLNAAIQPIYRILLALLLLPSEFGYIAVITLIVSFAELLNNVGIGEALIQKDDVNSNELSSLFFFNLVITMIITIILFFNAGSIEAFYSMKDLSLIIQLITVVILLNGSTSIFKFYLHRKFLFKETSIIRMLKMLTEVIIALILILLGFNIYGFVIAIIVSNFISALLITLVVFRKTDLKIYLSFSLGKIKRFLSFGIFVSMKKFLTFFSQRMDEIIIGGVLSPEVLGVYHLAKNLLIQLQTLITTSFGQVLLPTFSKMKNEREKQKYFYLKIVSILLFIGMPIFIMIIMSADIFVPVIFGGEWEQSANVFKLLALPTLCILLSAGVSTSLLYSQDKTFKVFIVDLIIVPIYIIILSIFNDEQLLNITIIYSVYLILKFLTIQVFVTNSLKIILNDYLKISQGTIISSFFMIIILLLVLPLLNYINDFIFLIFYVVIGFGSYLLINYLINKKNLENYYSTLEGIIKNK